MLALYKRKSPGSESLEDMFNIDCILSKKYDSPLKSVKVSSDSRYLVAYCEYRCTEEEQQQQEEHVEFLVLFDIENKNKTKLISDIELNLDDNL